MGFLLSYRQDVRRATGEDRRENHFLPIPRRRKRTTGRFPGLPPRKEFFQFTSERISLSTEGPRGFETKMRFFENFRNLEAKLEKYHFMLMKL